MAEQNKETVQYLKELAEYMQDIARTMRVQYRILSFWAYAEVLSFVAISVFMVSCNRILHESGTVFPAVLLLLILNGLSFVFYVLLRKQGKSFRQKYKEGREMLQTMADKAEWSRYKKKLIYKGNDESVSNAIYDFFSISEKLWSPCRLEKKYYTILILIFPPYTLISFLAFIAKAILGI